MFEQFPGVAVAAQNPARSSAGVLNAGVYASVAAAISNLEELQVE